jgi:FtsH-binding integral membrane protein
MTLTPYFPEPETVTGNVASAQYDVRLRFIRRVIALHFGIVVAVVIAASSVKIVAPIQVLAGAFVGLLLALSLVRRFAPSPRVDAWLSWTLLAPGVVATGLLARALAEGGANLWPVGMTAAACALYAGLCGRDFSFFGMFALAVPAGQAAALGLYLAQGWPLEELLFPSLLAVIHAFYFAYDLASLLRRRRPGEEWAAAPDLVRDMANFATYGVRVARHWQTFPSRL